MAGKLFYSTEEKRVILDRQGTTAVLETPPTGWRKME